MKLQHLEVQYVEPIYIESLKHNSRKHNDACIDYGSIKKAAVSSQILTILFDRNSKCLNIFVAIFVRSVN